MGVRQRATSLLGSCIALALCVAAPASGRAQVVLEGNVLDDVTQSRIPGSEVRLLNAEGHTVGFVVTDDSGHFRFTRHNTGWYRFEVRAVGYQPTRTPFVWSMVDHSYAAVEIRLAPHTTLLAPVEVIALSPDRVSPVLENVEHRKTRGFGIQISRQDIEQRHPVVITDVLVEVPGVYAARQGSGATGRRVYMTRALPNGGPCHVQVFLDGMLATRDVRGGDVDIDQLASPLDVEVIEVFRGLASIPPEFLTPDARCGVIAIWTKRYTGP